MSGPLGIGSGNPGKDVLAGTGISVSGTTAFTVSNTGVTSLAGSGVSVSAATGAVTVTAPTVTGGTGISVSGSGTTSLTVSATGVQSLTAGTGISVSGTTTPTVTNSGVTSIVAGTNVTVSGATGAVTVNAPGFATPGSSAIGDTATAGTATTVSRSDHVHGREAAGTPGASAVGDTASAGSATTVARSDHRHSREAFGTPVNLDASVTSLSAGSLTTVARADHIHTLSKVPVLLASTTLTTSTQYVTFSSIPQTYTDLILIYGVRLATASTYAGYQCLITVNGDTAANYTYYGLVNGLYAGQAHGATNYVTCPSANEVRFFNYSTTDQHKQVNATSAGWNNSTTAYNSANWSGNYTWLSNSAITSIRIAGSWAGDNMAAKSYFRLYGIL